MYMYCMYITLGQHTVYSIIAPTGAFPGVLCAAAAAAAAQRPLPAVHYNTLPGHENNVEPMCTGRQLQVIMSVTFKIINTYKYK
jgi:hypothetical protein